MRIVSFDLSTTCSGIAVATISGSSVEHLSTLAIVPQDINPTELGFLRTKRSIVTPHGDKLTSFVRTKDEVVTKKEKQKRDFDYRHANESRRATVMARGINFTVQTEKPDLILMEANMSFRSMDVTRKLAEIAGMLMSTATVSEIPLVKINVNHARERYNMSKLLQLFCLKRTPEELKKLKDVTKEAIKDMLLTKYSGVGLEATMTTDESDALLILDFYLATVLDA